MVDANTVVVCCCLVKRGWGLVNQSFFGGDDAQNGILAFYGAVLVGLEGSCGAA